MVGVYADNFQVAIFDLVFVDNDRVPTRVSTVKWRAEVCAQASSCSSLCSWQTISMSRFTNQLSPFVPAPCSLFIVRISQSL